MSAITRILPKRALSRLVGKLMHFQGPRWYANFTIKNFASWYNIALDEAQKPYTEYKSIGDFFVRHLKPGIRPIGSAWAVHPADSKITQAAAIDHGTLIQAKGHTYKLNEFTQDPDCDAKWGGGFFMTYYLCPTDYHRVHSPVDGVITAVRHLPGELWPVNEWSTANVPNLFSINERVLVEIQTDLGPVGVMFVGATNVGYIELAFDKTILGNQNDDLQNKHQVYNPPIAVKKGDELGMFRMGSTIVMIYPPMFRQKFEGHMNLGPSVKVNASLIK